jgi:hypothetical protein
MSGLILFPAKTPQPAVSRTITGHQLVVPPEKHIKARRWRKLLSFSLKPTRTESDGSCLMNLYLSDPS